MMKAEEQYAHDIEQPYQESVMGSKADMLENQAKEVLEERAKEYGDANVSFGRIANMWSAYTGVEITAKNVAMMMVLLKVSRSVGRDDQDDLIDGVNYLKLASEL